MKRSRLITPGRRGEREADGDFTAGSINRLVEDRLIHFSMQLKHFARSGKADNNDRDSDD